MLYSKTSKHSRATALQVQQSTSNRALAAEEAGQLEEQRYSSNSTAVAASLAVARTAQQQQQSNSDCKCCRAIAKQQQKTRLHLSACGSRTCIR